MSWPEVKKINSNLNKPLDVFIPEILELMIVGGYAWTKETTERTFTLPSGLQKIYVSMCGAGGGGGGGAHIPHPNVTSYQNGGTGGRGHYCIDQQLDVSNVSQLACKAGVAGSGGAGYNGWDQTYASNGTSGTKSYCGTLEMNGGTGGSGGYSAASGGTAAGGTPSGAITYFNAAYGNGGSGGAAASAGNPGSAGQNGIVVFTWGGKRLADIWPVIQSEISGGATHGGSI